jgi:hypothetical protein
MNSPADNPTTGVRQSGDAFDVPSLRRSLVIGGIGFCLASLCVFATVALAERWMYEHLGLLGAYVAWTVLFILLGGGSLTPLVTGSRRVLWCYAMFSAAFFMYAVGWTSAYFILRDGAGEWVGSLAGSVLMGLVIAAGFKVLRLGLKLSAILFVANSAGYFLGSTLNNSVRGKTGMLLWGVAYGLSLGVGLGAVLYLAQSQRASLSADEQR